jgi:internalin A
MEKSNNETNKEVAFLIRKSIEERAEILDLGNLSLSGNESSLSLLANCTHLKVLNLGTEYYTNEKKREYIKSKNKREKNQLKEIPSSLPSGLTHLFINENNISQIKNIELLTQLKTLDLSSNKIIQIENLQNQFFIENLHFDSNQIEEIKNLENQTNLEALFFNSNKINKIKNIDHLVKLKTLEVESNYITKIENIESLTQIQTLNLNSNRIEKIENLDFLINLKILYLESNKILKIENLQSLTNLVGLYLKQNQISKIENLNSLQHLNRLDLYKNEISKIENLESLVNLKTLWIYFNKIERIENLDTLVNLENLSLSGNLITKIENLTSLINLKYLYLYENKISKIENFHLQKLYSISLNNNNISKIENIEDLPELKNIDLSNNKIKSVPLYVLEDKSKSLKNIDGPGIDGLRLQNNPLENPPLDVLKQGREFAIEYLKSHNKKPLNECKVIIIGRGAVGKTSLQKRLVDDNDFKSKEKETHGIRKVCWENGIYSSDGSPIKINFWDFGGQHIQQTLHQFFYSENTLYLLVLDKRMDESPEDFLELIKVYSGNAPVIVVYNNKKDLKRKAKFEYELEPELDSTLRNKYPNIKKTIGICCGQSNDIGIKTLRSYMQILIPSLDHVKESYPINWLEIKNHLVNQSSEDYISFETYRAMCEKENVNKYSIQKGLAKMLNDVGTITFFDREFVGKYYILNPDWLTTGAYQIILSQTTRDKKGKINYADLKKIFSDKSLSFKYKEHEFEFLLSLMKEFNLCHEFSKNEWLVPSSLEGQSKTDLVKFKTEVHRLYSIEFETSLPTSIIHRFVARNINFAENSDYWKNGIVVKHPYSKTFIYVESDLKDKEIRLWIKGEQIRDCWEFFRKDFREFSGKFKYIENVEIDIEKKIKVSYQDLVDLLKVGEQEWFVPRFGKINIKETLGLFEEAMKIESDKIESNLNLNKFDSSNGSSLKSFISYSKFDGEETNDGTNYLEEFKMALTPLIEYNNRLSTWDCTLLIAGEDWDERIKKELNSADIIFILISNNLLSTNYVKNTELKIAFERESKKKCIVIPIIIRDCGWEDISWLSKNSAVPRKGHTIASWKEKFLSKDQAWNHVYKEVKNMIESFVAPK